MRPHAISTRRRSGASAFLAGLLVLVVLGLVPGPAGAAIPAPGGLDLVSAAPGGLKADTYSTTPAISKDGRRVAFQTVAGNLDSADGNGTDDIYVKDLPTGKILAVSATPAGVFGNGQSFDPSISADGTRVSFSTGARNLAPGDTDSIQDIQLKDLVTGNVITVSRTRVGQKGNGPSFASSISADGRRVAFASSATNLHPADSDDISDVYVKDLVTGELILVSLSAAGTKGTRSSERPAISADGTKVAFTSYSPNLHPDDEDVIGDVYLKDLVTGSLTLVSTSSAGIKSNRASYAGSVSADGKRVAFESIATNLHPSDSHAGSEVYVKDLATGELMLASAGATGVKGNFDSEYPRISADGSAVVFSSQATNLHPADTDPIRDVYVKHLDTGRITVASSTGFSLKANAASRYATISGAGDLVAFQSSATNLHPADANLDLDVYVKRLAAPATCRGRAATIEGTPGNDTIVGTPGDDVIHALGGHDTVAGGGGDDIICGGAGNDTIRGGSGNDKIDGEAGNDRLSGGGGHDILRGGAGRDTLDGGSGKDTLAGGADADVLRGGGGLDQLNGGAGNDTLHGDAHADVLRGGKGDDTLDGGAGKDKLFGDAGRDTLKGGAGPDTLNGGAGRDTLRGGAGRDICRGGPGADIATGCETKVSVP